MMHDVDCGALLQLPCDCGSVAIVADPFDRQRCVTFTEVEFHEDVMKQQAMHRRAQAAESLAARRLRENVRLERDLFRTRSLLWSAERELESMRRPTLGERAERVMMASGMLVAFLRWTAKR